MHVDGIYIYTYFFTHDSQQNIKLCCKIVAVMATLLADTNSPHISTPPAGRNRARWHQLPANGSHRSKHKRNAVGETFLVETHAKMEGCKSTSQPVHNWWLVLSGWELLLCFFSIGEGKTQNKTWTTDFSNGLMTKNLFLADSYILLQPQYIFSQVLTLHLFLSFWTFAPSTKNRELISAKHHSFNLTRTPFWEADWLLTLERISTISGFLPKDQILSKCSPSLLQKKNAKVETYARNLKDKEGENMWKRCESRFPLNISPMFVFNHRCASWGPRDIDRDLCFSCMHLEKDSTDDLGNLADFEWQNVKHDF